MTTEELLVKIKADTSELDRKLNNVKSNLEMNVDTKSAIKELNSIEKKLGEVFGKSKKNSIFGVLDSSLSDTEKKIKTLQSSIQSGLSQINSIEDNARGQVYNMQGADLAQLYGSEQFASVEDRQGNILRLTQEQYEEWTKINDELTENNDNLEEYVERVSKISSVNEEFERIAKEVAEFTAAGINNEDIDQYIENEMNRLAAMLTFLPEEFDGLDMEGILQKLLEDLKTAHSLIEDTEKKQDELLNQKPKQAGLLDTSSGFSRLMRYFSVGTILFKAAVSLWNSIKQRFQEGFSEGLENAYQYSKLISGEVADAMDSMKSVELYANNAMGAFDAEWKELWQPLTDWFNNGLADIFNGLAKTIAEIKSFFSGVSEEYLQAVYYSDEWASSSADTNKNLKETKKLISGFDELNIWSSNSGSEATKTAKEYSKMFKTAYTSFGDNDNPFAQEWKVGDDLLVAYQMYKDLSQMEYLTPDQQSQLEFLEDYLSNNIPDWGKWVEEYGDDWDALNKKITEYVDNLKKAAIQEAAQKRVTEQMEKKLDVQLSKNDFMEQVREKYGLSQNVDVEQWAQRKLAYLTTDSWSATQQEWQRLINEEKRKGNYNYEAEQLYAQAEANINNFTADMQKTVATLNNYDTQINSIDANIAKILQAAEIIVNRGNSVTTEAKPYKTAAQIAQENARGRGIGILQWQ